MLLDFLHHELTVLYKIPKKPIIRDKKGICLRGNRKKVYPWVRVIEITGKCAFPCYHFNKEKKYYVYDYINGGDIFYTEKELQPTFYYSHYKSGTCSLIEAPLELLKAVNKQLKIQESYKT